MIRRFELHRERGSLEGLGVCPRLYGSFLRTLVRFSGRSISPLLRIIHEFQYPFLRILVQRCVLGFPLATIIGNVVAVPSLTFDSGANSRILLRAASRIALDLDSIRLSYLSMRFLERGTYAGSPSLVQVSV